MSHWLIKISYFLPFALVMNTLCAVCGTSLVSDWEPFGNSLHKQFCDKRPENLWKDCRSLLKIDTVCKVKWLVNLGNNVKIHSGKTRNCLGRNFAEWFSDFPEWIFHSSKRIFTDQLVISLDVLYWLSKQVKMPRRWNDRFARYVHTKWQDPWLMTKKMRSR